MATGGVSAAVMRDLECPVCHEVLRTPKVLPCGHSLCATPCLQQLAGDQDHVKCPECREAHSVPVGGTSKFPNNFFLCRIVENTKSSVCQDQSRCPGCSADSVVLRRCSHCGSHICEVCREEHTEIMKKDLLKQFSECLGKIKSAELDQKEGPAMKRLDEKVTAIQDEVNRVTELFHQIINKRKLELYQCIDAFKTSEVNQILAKRQKTRDANVTFCKEKQLILDGDVPQLLLMQLEDELYDRMKFQSEDKDIEISDATLCVDEKGIAQSLSKFGEIKDVVKETKSALPPVPVVHAVPSKDNNPEISDASLCADHEKVTTQPLSKFSETEDSHHVVKETMSAVPNIPVVKAVPLDIDRKITKIKCSIGGQGTEPGLFSSPTAVRVSPVTGNIVVADGGNKRIQIFSPQGKFIHLFTKPYDDHKLVKQLEISTKGDIVILCQNDIITSYNELGQIIYECLVKGATSAALAPNGDVHVGTDGGGVPVLRQGRVVNSYIIGREKGIADRIFIDNSGRIFVLQYTERKPNMKIMKSYCRPDTVKHFFSYDKMFFFNREYQLIKQIHFGEIPKSVDCMHYNEWHQFQPSKHAPIGSLRLISGKYFLTTDPESHTITIYDLEWKMVKKINSETAKVCGLVSPRDAAVTLDGNLVVVTGNHMMQFF